MPEDRRDPRNTFSRSAGRYLTSTDHQSGPDLGKIREVASQLFPCVTVDVAAGAGHALRVASPFSGLCVALDLTWEMLRVAKDHLAKAGMENVHFIQSSADHLPLAENSVSLLTCRIAPHHFPSVPGFLEEVGRVLEPQGHGVIIDSVVPAEEPVDRFINEVEFLRDPSHIRSYTLEQWLAFIEKSSLEIVSVELFERTHMFVEWAGRTGLDELEIKVVEHRFREASPDIRERLKVQLDERGRVLSYTDEKGTFVLKLGTG